MIDLPKADCCGCGACAQACPKNCITMQQDAEGFLYPAVDQAVCIRCGKCQKVCPAVSAQKPDGETRAFAVCNKNETIRQHSSSGGVFTALAEYVIGQGGVVFGAAFSEDHSHVLHIMVDTIEGLARLRGSKYLQSKISNCYVQCKQLLDLGRPVLFTGTPCQIEGLLKSLSKPYDNLLCADLICHGVPSPKAWARYLEGAEKTCGARPQAVHFRDKTDGWRNFRLRLSFADRSLLRGQCEPFMAAFLQNLCLRPSCHSCKFKYAHRPADLTMADFWGIEKVLPEMDDDRGTSLVLVHSDKGRHALERIAETLTVQQVELQVALEGNPAAISPVPAHRNRAEFFRKLDSTDFDKLSSRLLAPKRTVKGLVRRVLRKCKRLLIRH